MFRALSWVGSESGISEHPIVIRIGIRNSETGENVALEALHNLGFAVLFMVVTDEMKEAMDREMAEVVVERLLLFVGLTAGRFIGDGDVAEHARCVVGFVPAGGLQRRKRQHVGRLVDAAP